MRVKSFDNFINEYRNSYPSGWAILPAGNIKLATGDTKYFNVIENNGNTVGTLILVEKQNGGMAVYSSSGKMEAEGRQDCHHDQNPGRTWSVKVIGTYPATIEGMAQIKDKAGKGTLPFSVFK